jgi:hypothetical protein
MDDLALRDACGDAGLHGPLEDATEPLGAPALPYPRQRGMIGQPLLQAVPGEPADRQVDLRLAQQPPVVDDAEQEACQHQPERRLRRYPRPPDARRVERANLGRKPGEVQHPVDPCKDMIFRNEITQRAADEELKLSPLLLPQHLNPRLDHCPSQENQEPASFSTAPSCIFTATSSATCRRRRSGRSATCSRRSTPRRPGQPPRPRPRRSSTSSAASVWGALRTLSTRMSARP